MIRGVRRLRRRRFVGSVDDAGVDARGSAAAADADGRRRPSEREREEDERRRRDEEAMSRAAYEEMAAAEVLAPLRAALLDRAEWEPARDGEASRR